MFYPRSFDDILTQYLAALEDSGAGLDLQINPSSPLYVLARANSTVIADLESELVDVFTSTSPITATGFDLDSLMFIPEVQRLDSSLATGSIIIKPTTNAITIPIGTILTDLDSGLQFSTTQAALTSKIINTIIPITSLTTGFSNNLTAGTNLFSPDYPTVNFFVGSSLSADNIFNGDLTGGSDLETDDSLRTRFFNYLTNSNRPSSILFIKDLVLSYPSILKCFVKTNLPGIIEIWVNFSSLDGSSFYSDTEVDALKQTLTPFIPAGITLAINEAKIKYCQLSLSIIPYSAQTDLTALNSDISSAIDNIIADLDIGQTLSLSSIISAVLPFVAKVVITDPISDITPQLDEVVVVSSIKLTLPSY